MSNMRGYFGVGVENISKEANAGTIARTTHAFGGSFFFAVKPDVDLYAMKVSDTSGAFDHMPYYQYKGVEDMTLPEDCVLVGVELTEESVDLPSFRHPLRAAYVLGPEMGSLSPEMTAKCHHVVKIPMKFCVNVGVAAAIVIYDRMLCLGRHAERPVRPGGPLPETKPQMPKAHRRKSRKKKKQEQGNG